METVLANFKETSIHRVVFHLINKFQVFYWTHLLYIPFWVLLFFHGPNFWKWFIIPGVIYIVERILRLTWMRYEFLHIISYLPWGLRDGDCDFATIALCSMSENLIYLLTKL